MFPQRVITFIAARCPGGPFSRINQALLEATTYKDTEVVGGAHYFYVVTAVGEGGPESAYSNEVSVEIPND